MLSRLPDLAEEEAAVFSLLRVTPVLQQPSGNSSDSGVGVSWMLAPGFDARANLVD